MSDFPLKDYNTGVSLTIGLNSLASGAMTLSTTVIDNTGAGTSPLRRFDEIVVELTIASASFISNSLDGALVPSLDGSNFQSIGGATFPVGSDGVPVAYAWVDATTAGKRALLRFRRLGPMFYKVLVRNGLGANFTASGNTATWRGSVRETR